MYNHLEPSATNVKHSAQDSDWGRCHTDCPLTKYSNNQGIRQTIYTFYLNLRINNEKIFCPILVSRQNTDYIPPFSFHFQHYKQIFFRSKHHCLACNLFYRRPSSIQAISPLPFGAELSQANRVKKSLSINARRSFFFTAPLLKRPSFCGNYSPQGAEPHPPPSSTRGKAGSNHLNEEITPPPPHWDRRAMQPNHIKFRTCSALAPMLTPPVNESAELTQGALYNEFYTLRCSRINATLK